MIIITATRVIAGIVFVMFLPGYAWSLAVFPRGSVGVLERAIYSIAISISLVSAAFFFANRFLGIDINMIGSSLILAAVAVLGLAYVWCRNRGMYARLGKRLFGRRSFSRGGGPGEE